jgi:PKD repeat protein
LTVNFSDSSTGVITSFAWIFGDGDMSSLQNPSHTYSAAGSYTVSLTVTGPGGSNTSTLTDYIVVQELPPLTDFSGTPLSGVAPLTVNFTDLTTGVATGYAWTFGDSGTSSLQNPSHTYSAAGMYTVALTSTGPGGPDTETKPDYVIVLEPPPEAGFSATPLAGSAPLIVTFTDLSTGAVSAWSWSFGDASTSTGQHPMHLYTTPGTFTVSLTVTGPGGLDSETKVDYITIDLSLDDGSFEGQLAGMAPASPWASTGGPDHLIQPDTGVFVDNDFPTDQDKWVDLSSEGSSAAIPPDNPGGSGSLPSGVAGISQTFTFTPQAPVLLFDAAFLRGEPADSPTANDFMSVDVSDGTTHHNLYYADTFSDFPDVSARHGMPMTERTRVQADLAALFPTATSATVLTVYAQVGNDGNGLNTSRGYADSFLLGTRGSAVFRNGSGVNPAIYGVSATVLGGSWNADFDLTDFPMTTFTFVITYAAGVPGIDHRFGELLVDLGSTLYFISISASGIPHTQNVPNNLSFLGLTGHSQGLLYAGGVFTKFTNAAELKIGLQTDPRPTADFNALPATGAAPLTVSFFDLSSGSITGSVWDFGDGNTSTLASPQHTYINSGTYSVSLIVTGPGGFDIRNQYDLIVVP